MTTAQPSSSALRFLLPSVRDIIFIFLFWSLLVGPLSNRPLADADIGWHIRTGEQILATHSLPRTDSFSSTMQGQPWFAWEWLYDVLLGLLHRCCGLNGVAWLCALLTATIFAGLLSQLLQRGTSLVLALHGRGIGIGAREGVRRQDLLAGAYLPADIGVGKWATR